MKTIIAPFLIANFMRPPVNATSTQEYSKLFKNYHSCFILYDFNAHKIVAEYNPNNYCNERLSPNSTFKIPLSLMAFDQGIITQKTVFKWDGIKRDIPQHDQNQTPHSWLKYSMLWVSQRITPKLGDVRIKQYLADFKYGDQDFNGDVGKNNDITHAWLSSSLKISEIEQLH